MCSVYVRTNLGRLCGWALLCCCVNVDVLFGVMFGVMFAGLVRGRRRAGKDGNGGYGAYQDSHQGELAQATIVLCARARLM